MITLTFDDRAPDARDDPKYYTHAWDTFLKRMRRRYPRLRFARIVELHRSGRPHFHILVNQFIPQKYISWAFEECGGGKVADCRYVDPGRAARYVTKYLTKSFSGDHASAQFFFLTRMRAVSVSRGLYFKVPLHPDRTLQAFMCIESTDVIMAGLEARSRLLEDTILISDPGGPDCVWHPNVTGKSYHLNPRESFRLDYAHVQAWSLNLTDLPDHEGDFLVFPPGLDAERTESLQASFPFRSVPRFQ